MEGDGWTQVMEALELPHQTYIRVGVSGHYLTVTPTHPFEALDLCGNPVMCRAEDISLSHQLHTRTGADFVEHIQVIRDPEATKVKIWCEPHHTFFCGEDEPFILAHNQEPVIS